MKNWRIGAFYHRSTKRSYCMPLNDVWAYRTVFHYCNSSYSAALYRVLANTSLDRWIESRFSKTGNCYDASCASDLTTSSSFTPNDDGFVIYGHWLWLQRFVTWMPIFGYIYIYIYISCNRYTVTIFHIIVHQPSASWDHWGNAHWIRCSFV